jgi:hypothetical protein
MFELNFINQKSYVYSPPDYIPDLKIWASWYFVDVLADRPLDADTYSVNPEIFDEGLRLIKLSQGESIKKPGDIGATE